MPKPNHGTKKKPGRAKWFSRRNVHREHKRRKDANDLDAIIKFRKAQPRKSK